MIKKINDFLRELKKFYKSNPKGARWFVLAVIMTFFILKWWLFSNEDSSGGIPVPLGAFQFMVLIGALIGGINYGDQDNKPSLVLSFGVIVVVVFFFSSMISGYIDKYLIAPLFGDPEIISRPEFILGLMVLALGIVGRKVMNLPKTASWAFIGGAVLIGWSFIGPAISPDSFSAYWKNIADVAEKIVTNPKLKSFLAAIGLAKIALVSVLVFWWFKKPLSISRAFVVVLVGMAIIHFNTAYFAEAYERAPLEVKSAVQAKKKTTVKSFGRYAKETSATDRRKNVRSRKEVANSGIFYIQNNAALCKAITLDGRCEEFNYNFNGKKYLKIFVVRGKFIETEKGTVWEKVELKRAGGKEVYVFSGDLIEGDKLVSDTGKKSQTKEELVDTVLELKEKNKALNQQLRAERGNSRNALNAQKATAKARANDLKNSLAEAEAEIRSLKLRTQSAEQTAQRVEKEAGAMASKLTLAKEESQFFQRIARIQDKYKRQ